MKTQLSSKTLICFFLFLSTCFSSFAQQISFGKEYWYIEYYDIGGRGVVQLPDGGYLFTANDRVGAPISTFKTTLFNIDSIGNIRWMQRISIRPTCLTNSIIMDSDSTYLIFGQTWNPKSFGATCTFIQRRSVEDSLLLMDICLGDIQYVDASSMILAENGDIIVCGQGVSLDNQINGGYICRLNKEGNLLWASIIPDGCDTTYEGFNKVTQLTDGSFMATGWSTSSVTINLPYNLFIAHVSADGQLLHSKVYPPPIIPPYQPTSNSGMGICGLPDGNALVCCNERSPDTTVEEISLYKVTPQCDTLWRKLIPGPEGFWSVGSDIQKTSDGGFLICGTSFGPISSEKFIPKFETHENSKISLNKSSAYKNLINKKDFKNNQEILSQIKAPVIIRLDSNINEIWAEVHTLDNCMTYLLSVMETSDKGAAAIGTTHCSNAQAFHIYFLKTDTLGLVMGEKEISLPKTEEAELSIYPNPVRENCHIHFGLGARQIQLFNLQGQVTREWLVPQGCTFMDVSLKNLPTGIYLFRVTGNEGVKSMRVVKM